MKNIGIHEPCSENWNAMTPTEKGRFCSHCATQVYDFTNKSPREIKQTLRELIGQPVCGRITAAQEDHLNAEFDAWKFRSKRSFQSALVFSLVVVFGLSLFSCSNEEDRQQIEQIRQTAVKTLQQQEKRVQQVTPTVEVPQVAAEIYPEQVFVTVDLDAVTVEQPIETHNYFGSSYGGAMISTHEYRVFLEETAPDPFVPEELDENGIPFPTAFDALVFPNPAITETTFELKVPVKNNFEIQLLDMNGKLLQTVHSGAIDRGAFRRRLDLIDLAPGMYIVAIVSQDYKETVKISKI
jgi:hypothetical protein